VSVAASRGGWPERTQDQAYSDKNHASAAQGRSGCLVALGRFMCIAPRCMYAQSCNEDPAWSSTVIGCITTATCNLELYMYRAYHVM
jgi:hypothetical protein